MEGDCTFASREEDFHRKISCYTALVQDGRLIKLHLPFFMKTFIQVQAVQKNRVRIFGGLSLRSNTLFQRYDNFISHN